MFTGDSDTLGTDTNSEASAVSPANSNSFTSDGCSPAVVFMASAMSSTTTLTTNSPVASTFARASFDFHSACRATPMTTVGGVYDTALKNEKGARFATPSPETVETRAIGRGTITPVRTLLNSSISCGTILAGSSLPSGSQCAFLDVYRWQATGYYRACAIASCRIESQRPLI